MADSIQVPEYFLARPDMELSEEKVAAFERLFAEAVEGGTGAEIEYTLHAPKWQFLCYVADNKNVVLHGSGDPNIEEFEPRQSNDVDEFGNRSAVYAASDGIWPMYFAIVDRERYVRSLVNASFRVIADGATQGPYYFFSVNADALPHNPWRQGMMYILPRDTFEQQPPYLRRGVQAQTEQWASLVPVKPLAKLAVGPGDFPFLAQIRGHDPKVVFERATRDPDGFPWLGDGR